MNKTVKSLAAALAFGMVFSASAASQEGYVAGNDDAWKWSPVGLSLAAPLQLPWMASDVYGLRLGGFFASNVRMYGLDLGIAEKSDVAFRGMQVAAFGWTGADAYGLRVDALASVTDGRVFGCDLAPVQVVWAEFTGLQLGAVNYDSEFTGAQVGGLLNWCDTGSRGFQLAVANADQDYFIGCSIGAVNRATDFTGCALGVVNVADSVRGVQIGLFNACDNMAGVQIGLANLITSARLPIMILANARF